MEQNVCVIKSKKTLDRQLSQRIIVYLDSLQVPLDNIGYLVSPAVMNLRPFPFASNIQVAYLRTHRYEIWFPYLPFYRFSPDRDALVIKAERLKPQVNAVTQYATILNELYSNNFQITVTPSRIPNNMFFCKCTNPPEEEYAILERDNFAQKILQRFFKISDATADKFDEIMLILDEYLEKFHTQHIPTLYYNLSGVAGDFELLTALISAVAGNPEALGLELLAGKGDIIQATRALEDRKSRLRELLSPGEAKDDLIKKLTDENMQLKRFVQQVQQQMQQQKSGGG